MKNELLLTAIAVSMSATVSGCADLESRQLDTTNGKPLSGEMSYYLPQAVITISGTMTLESCPIIENGQPKGNLTYSVNLTPSVSIEADPNHIYTIPYEHTDTWLKSIDYTLESYENKTIKSFNGSIDDHAGKVITGLIAPAINIITAATMPLAGKAELSSIESVSPSPHVDRLLYAKDLAELFPKIKEQEDIKSKEYAQVNVVTNKTTEVQWEAKKAEAARKIAIADGKIANMKRNLTRKVSYKWLPNGSQESFPPDDNNKLVTMIKAFDLKDVLLTWITPDSRKWYSELNEKKKESYAIYDKLTVQLEFDHRFKGNAAPTAVASENSLKGLVVRDPVIGVLTLCNNNPSNSGCGPTSDGIVAGNRLAQMNVSVPQLGRMLVLPLRNTLFENSTLKVEVNKDGIITKMGYTSGSTASDGLASATAASTAAIANVNARNNATTTANTSEVSQAQFATTVNKALAECLTARDAVVKAGGTPVSCQ